jgi:hypothetical protein
MKKGALLYMAWSLACTLGALAVVTLYLIIPSMVVLSPVLRGNWSQLLGALGLLGLVEIAVLTVLIKTTPSYQDQPVQLERREAVRVPTDLDVEVGNAYAGGGDGESPMHGRTLNISHSGMAVLIRPDRSVAYPDHVTLRVHLPEGSVSAEARLLESEDVLVDDRRHHRLRLHLLTMDHDDRQRYLRHLTKIGVVDVATTQEANRSTFTTTR